MDEWLLDGWERPIGNGERSAPSDPFQPVSFLHSCRPAISMFCKLEVYKVAIGDNSLLICFRPPATSMPAMMPHQTYLADMISKNPDWESATL